MMTRGLASLPRTARSRGGRLDARKAAAGDHNGVATVLCRTLRQAMQMLIKGNRVTERVDGKAVLG
jgi:hypothetical protein